jgi:hypothetical protein
MREITVFGQPVRTQQAIKESDHMSIRDIARRAGTCAGAATVAGVLCMFALPGTAGALPPTQGSVVANSALPCNQTGAADSGSSCNYSSITGGTPFSSGQLINVVIPASLIPAPSGLGATPSATGGSLATGTYTYEVTATNADGETTPSSSVNASVTGPTGSVSLLWSAVTGATGYNVYGNEGSGSVGLIGSAATTSFVDTGSTPGASPPTSNTTPVFTNPNATLEVVECAAPNGVTPTQTSACDGDTAQGSGTLFPNPNGSVNYYQDTTTNSLYTVYAIPDPALSEGTSGPKCGSTSATECILYIGTNVGSFTAPHVWSQPFFVHTNADGDSGDNPGDGTPEVPMAIMLPLAALILIGGTVLVRRRRADADNLESQDS